MDAAFGVVSLAIIGSSTAPEDRTTSINWVMPLTVGGALGCSFISERGEGFALTAGMSAAYTLTVAEALKSGSGRAATAVANIASYPGFFVVGHFAVSVARRMASEIDEARRREVERSSELASEKERNAAHRMIHDSALQTLEALSRDTALSPEEVRAIATAEAATLRRSITDGDHEPASLIVSLRRLVDRFDRRGLKVRLVTEDTTFHPDPTVTTALCDAGGRR